jgi:hypothetical protein
MGRNVPDLFLICTDLFPNCSEAVPDWVSNPSAEQFRWGTKAAGWAPMGD